MKEIYLDNNASSRPLPEVVEAMSRAMLDGFGNASSAHESGERARRLLAKARSQVAALINADPNELIFASGGTEANNLAIRSIFDRPKPWRFVTTEVEHSSILKEADWLETLGVEVVRLPVDGAGRIDPDDLRDSLARQVSLVSIQWVNNETGVIQPVMALSEICAEAGVPFHCDAAQAAGKLHVAAGETGITHLTFTAHKIHGPQGVGALWAKNPKSLAPVLHGGSQERSVRPGTENLPGIVGFGVAADIRARKLASTILDLTRQRDHLEEALLAAVPELSINGDRDNRVCNTTNIRFGELDGQALVARLDRDGIRCSQSSACTNRRPEPSYVLRAMGLAENAAYASVRFSVSVLNNEEEIDVAAIRIAHHAEQLSILLATMMRGTAPEVSA